MRQLLEAVPRGLAELRRSIPDEEVMKTLSAAYAVLVHPNDSIQYLVLPFIEEELFNASIQSSDIFIVTALFLVGPLDPGAPILTDNLLICA
jgi:hypothetical protein